MVSEKMMENEKHNISAVMSRPGIKIKLSQHYYGQELDYDAGKQSTQNIELRNEAASSPHITTGKKIASDTVKKKPRREVVIHSQEIDL